MSRRRTLDLRSMTLDDLQRTAELIIEEMRKRAADTAAQLAEITPMKKRLRKWCARHHDQDIHRKWRKGKDGQMRPDGCGLCHRENGLKQPFTTEFCEPT